MPAPSAIFDPNLQAAGLMPGILLDQLLQQARSSLTAAATPGPPALATPPFGIDMGGTASPGPDLSGLTPASTGARANLSLGLPALGANLAGRFGGPAAATVLGPIGFGLGTMGLFGNMMDALMDVFGVGRAPAVGQTVSQMGFTGSTPEAQAAFGAQRAGERSGSAPTPDLPGTTAPSDTTGTDVGADVGGVGAAPYGRGGKIGGPKGKKKRVTAHSGEFVMNPEATARFEPWLQTMNAAVQPDDGLDGLIKQANGYFED